MKHLIRLVTCLGLLAVTTSALAMAGTLDRPGLALPEAYPQAQRERLMAALNREDCKFAGGRYVNWITTLEYSGNTEALNLQIDALTKVREISIHVRFSKAQSAAWQIHHGASGPGELSIMINPDAPGINLANLRLPPITTQVEANVDPKSSKLGTPRGEGPSPDPLEISPEIAQRLPRVGGPNLSTAESTVNAPASLVDPEVLEALVDQYVVEKKPSVKAPVPPPAPVAPTTKADSREPSPEPTDPAAPASNTISWEKRITPSEALQHLIHAANDFEHLERDSDGWRQTVRKVVELAAKLQPGELAWRARADEIVLTMNHETRVATFANPTADNLIMTIAIEGETVQLGSRQASVGHEVVIPAGKTLVVPNHYWCSPRPKSAGE